MEEFMEQGDQLLAEREIEKPGDEEIDDIEHFHATVGNGGHLVGMSAHPATDRFATGSVFEAERMDFGVSAVYSAAAGGGDTDQNPLGIYMAELRHF